MVIQNLYGNPKTKSVRLNFETWAKGPKGGRPTCAPMQPPMTHRSPLHLPFCDRGREENPTNRGFMRSRMLKKPLNQKSWSIWEREEIPHKQGGHASQIAQMASRKTSRARGDPPTNRGSCLSNSPNGLSGNGESERRSPKNRGSCLSNSPNGSLAVSIVGDSSSTMNCSRRTHLKGTKRTT
jgi:hypothetical protein